MPKITNDNKYPVAAPSLTDEIVILSDDVMKKTTVASLKATPQTPLSSAPSDPAAGATYLADRTNWDPLALGSGGAYAVMYLGAVSGWGSITDQLD